VGSSIHLVFHVSQLKQVVGDQHQSAVELPLELTKL
jgi:hypothetical protein